MGRAGTIVTDVSHSLRELVEIEREILGAIGPAPAPEPPAEKKAWLQWPHPARQLRRAGTAVRAALRTKLSRDTAGKRALRFVPGVCVVAPRSCMRWEDEVLHVVLRASRFRGIAYVRCRKQDIEVVRHHKGGLEVFLNCTYVKVRVYMVANEHRACDFRQSGENIYFSIEPDDNPKKKVGTLGDVALGLILLDTD